MTIKINTSERVASPKYLRTNKIDRSRNKNTLKGTPLKGGRVDPFQLAPEFKDQ
jgi:hypothetical protein